MVKGNSKFCLKKVFVLLIICAIFTTSAIGAEPAIQLIAPMEGVYFKSGLQRVDFNVMDSDINGSTDKELLVDFYYSNVQGQFQNFISSHNLSDQNLGFCQSPNFTSFVRCFVNITLPIISDGNYFLDMNFYEKQVNTINDFNKISSKVFYVDNTPPTIKFTSPDVNCNSNTNITSNNLKFTLSDTASGVATATIAIIGIQRNSSFNFSNACSTADGGRTYVCDYNELAIDRTGSYNTRAFAYDRALNQSETRNSADCNVIFHYSDNTPPAKPLRLITYAGPGSITLTWSANTDYDLNGYKIYYRTNDCNFTKATGTFAGFTTRTNYVLQDLNSDLNYYFRISAVDFSGNESELSDCNKIKPNIRILPSLPEFSSNTHKNNVWSKDRNVIITWNAIPGAIGYSCTWDTSAAKEPDKVIDSNSYCSNRRLDLKNLNEGVYYLKVRACDANGICSNVATFTVKIDFTKPSKPSNLGAVIDNNNVKLTWNASTDARSGIKEYRVYRGTASDFNIDENNRRAILVDTTWTDTKTSSGTKYYYKVLAIDNAGNESDIASVNIATAAAKVVVDISQYVNAGSKSVRIRSTDELIDAYVYIKKASDSDWIKIKGPITDDDFTATFTVESGDDGVAKIRVIADNLEETIKTFEIDTKKPEIVWIAPEQGASIDGTYLLKVKINESQTKMESVTFYIDNNKITTLTTASEEGLYWSHSWNTANLPKGSYTLKAVALDKAGNEALATVNVGIGITSTQPPKKTEAEKKISDIMTKRTEAANMLQSIRSYNLEISKEATDLYNAVLQAIFDANTNYSKGDYDSAIEKANEASAKLNALFENYGFSEAETKVLEISKDIAKELLLANGFANDAAEEAAKKTVELSAKKIIKVLMIKDKNVTKYYIKVFLQFKSSDDKILLWENIPKDLAKNASQIKSDVAFEVIKDDPVLLFKPQKKDSEDIIVEYYLKTPINAAEYQALKAKNAFEPTAFALVLEQQLPGGGILEVILYAVVILFLLLIVGLIILYILKRKNSSFGGGKAETQRRGPRWAYRG
ncbi:MAG: Ig-like domain-containing protein [Candidatus Diapherotrites archaeon]|nr:Ig-like domain-containing protein [Candidatus Diapherotrites archaeon]